RRLGRALAPLLETGDVLALTGELGAGKTCLVQGLAAGLGVDGPVTSPTFMLQRTYRGRLPLVHLDVYRLEHVQDVLDLGDEALADDVVTVVEWGDTIAQLLPIDRLDLELRHEEDLLARPPADGAPVPDLTDDRPRIVHLVARGAWVDRITELAAPGDGVEPVVVDEGTP
ncbi:tRNA (adenosine(37)-N6)-threonylcarbamoyltransferase complex ATPase subunit type 1 TsaE, partial [Salsipaludibacter albus]|uniref:tRNA (adenosine(37)-N6)-threonylcarbamoyltransferase complex ATPase subunit type 1 TsaE n=1 Tax=Salsipaludibacter albus TaxID=2849650 RepID=UPI001EE4BAC7